jgi:hypothetical protein
MAEFPGGHDPLLRQLISTFRCQVCRSTFESERVRIAARHEQLWVVSVRCHRCRNQQMFWFALSERNRGDTPGDLTSEEQERFSAMAPVSSDDVLDMHLFLADFKGDFQQLFAP